MQIFESLFNEFYSPTFYRAIKEQGTERIAVAWNAYASAYIPAAILFGAFLAGSGPFLVKLLLGERFQVVTSILIWPALTETMRAISSSLFTMGIAKVDMRINLPPVAAGATTAPVLVYLLAPVNPLLGTGIALFTGAVVVLSIAIFMTYRALPVTWPVRRIVIALALGLPMVIGGNIAGSWVSDMTWAKAAIAVTLVGASMIAVQYLVARHWLHDAYAVLR